MGGGNWISQNKTRPGCYINFESVAKGSMTVGDRGVMTMMLPLKWGESDKLIEVLSSELLDGSSQKKVGFTAFDSDAKLVIGALSYCYKILVYRGTTGGVKATATEGILTYNAKYAGSFGNNITIVITKDSNNVYTVSTLVKNISIDVQKITQASQLINNDYVDFVVGSTGSITETSGTPLTGGTDGTMSEATAYPLYFAKLRMSKWQVLCCNSTTDSIKSSVVTFISDLRENEGRYVQGVVCNYAGANYEGIINSVCGAVIDGVSYSADDFTAIVAGMTAGANFNESNTAKEIKGATSIVGELTDAEIKSGLEEGKFILSTSISGKVKVEQDINSLHTFTSNKNYTFSKNRVIRTLDEIGTTTKITWEDSYMGKVNNNDDGRDIFKADLISYGLELERLNGIQNFTAEDDIEVVKGSSIDSVVVTWNVMPVDAMEKLYMTVYVNN